MTMKNREIINPFPDLSTEIVPEAIALLMLVSELNHGDLNNVIRTCLFFSEHVKMKGLLQEYREFNASEKLMTLHFDNESKLNLKQYLNNECKRIIQLGAATGNFLNKYKKKTGT